MILQRVYTSKEETSLSTVSIEAFSLSCVFDAQEGKDVTTVNIPGAFLQTKTNDNTIINLQGLIVDSF